MSPRKTRLGPTALTWYNADTDVTLIAYCLVLALGLGAVE